MLKFSVRRPMMLAGLIASACALVSGLFGIKYLLICAVIIMVLSLIFLREKTTVFVVMIAVLMFVINFINTSANINSTEKFCYSSYNLNLIATEKPVKNGYYGSVEVLSKDNGKFPANQRFTLYYNGSLPVKAGDIFNASVKIQPLKDTQNKLYNYSKGTYFRLKLRNFNGIVGNNGLYNTMSNIRQAMEEKLFLNLSKDSASTMCAITYGDDSYISNQFGVNIRRSGVSHIMVVSGMHLAIIMGTLFFIFDHFFYNRFLRTLLSVISIFLICGICGFTISIMRAGIMYILAALAPLLFRENDTVNTLGTTIALVVIATPYAIFNVSFLLSVLATYGVIAPAPFYSQLFSRKINKDNFVLRGGIAMFCNTMCAMIMTLPITVYCFSEVSLISPVTNIALSYPVDWALNLTFFALILSFIPILNIISIPLYKLVEFFTRYINITINDLGSYRYSAVTAGKWSVVVCVALLLAMILFMYYKKLREYNTELKEE